MAALRQDLKAELVAYALVDDQVKDLNKRIAELREQRSLIEDRISVFMMRPEFVGFEKMSMNADPATGLAASMIKVKRAGTYEATWSLSRGKLRDLARAYFAGSPDPTADGLYEFILTSNKRMANTFAIERIVAEPN
jgi:hypothetical protein